MGHQLHKRFSWHIVWQILGEFADGTINAQRASEWLEISRSRLYALKDRWKKTPPSEANTHWLYQRSGAGPHALPEDVQAFIKKELRYIREESEFFRGHMNFARLADQCHRQFGHRFHRNTLRRWAIREGLYDPKIDTTAKAFTRFETGGIGMLFQHDSSIHLWVPHTRRQDILILSIDDHSRKVVGARLVPQDTAWHHLSVIRQTVEIYGRPLAYYTDNHLLFYSPAQLQTQVSRALHSLDIALKLTGKAQPQAKGKVEKRFDYFQRRVPYECERYNVRNLTEANKVLKELVEYYNDYHIHDETQERPNERWKKALQEGRSYLRPIPEKTPLDIIFALHYKRHFKADGTVWFAGQRWEVPHAPRWGEATVVLRPPSSARRPHTEIFVLHKGNTLRHIVLSRQRLTPPPV